MNRVPALWHLQNIDQELDDKTKRARLVDEQLANDPNVVGAHAAHDAEQKQLAELRGKLRDRELEAKSLDAKIKEVEARLYGGRVTSPKELDGMEKDLQMHKRQRSDLDDQLLTLMDSIDQVQARAEEKSRGLEKIERTRAGDVERLTRERDALAARLVELEHDREQTRAALDAESLRTYEQFCRTKAGRAVALIRRESCSACGVTVPTGLIRRVQDGDELVFCSGCGRILAA